MGQELEIDGTADEGRLGPEVDARHGTVVAHERDAPIGTNHGRRHELPEAPDQVVRVARVSERVVARDPRSKRPEAVRAVGIQDPRPHSPGCAHSIARSGRAEHIGADVGARTQIIELCGIYGARIVDVGHTDLTISLADVPSRLDDFEDLLVPFGIAMVQRTGRVALPKLDRSS